MAMIYLIRHGQASFFKSEYDQLTDLGVQQSKYAGRSLKNRSFQCTSIFSGTLSRHTQTATHCLKELGIKEKIEQSPYWNEYDHTELLGKYNSEFSDFDVLKKHIMKHPAPLKALQDILNQSIINWIENKHEYSTTWASFKENVWGEIEKVASSLSSRENTLVFTSGGPISAIVMKAMKLKDDQFIELQNRIINTSITKILVGKSGLSVSTYNDYGHLEHDSDWITYR